ncbi:MAG TPA: methenyltetrahydromethanopterin cyclohydrolase [Gemmataceae bacterium]|nr:methenyltetrahydromethanopterin cyclohydrolase [Gemmataceae bacterium]
MAATLTLNERALRLADYAASSAPALRIQAHTTTGGAKVIDCGVKTPGGLQAGLALARVCLAGQGEVALTPGEVSGIACPSVVVNSDHPILACMASQYAGWPIQVGKFFAMGSGPMRAVWAKEDLFQDIPGKEEAPVAVGCLETSKLPDDAVIEHLSQELRLPANKITLLAAPASSQAGSLQVVARSLETALHKLHELKFDLKQVVSGFGSAPLPPVARDTVTAIGRTNDAILYGGRVTLWVDTDDDQLADIGPKVPACASSDYGAPFASIFERAGHDFYKIDPMLFSPAEIVFSNLKTGRAFAFGRTKSEVLLQSFFG